MANKANIALCSIRHARDDDSVAVRSLYAQLCPDVSDVDRDFRAMLADPRAICLIVEMAHKPVGMVFGYVRSTLSAGRKLVVDELVVDRAVRGQRLGSLLLEHCIGMAKEQGLDSVPLAACQEL